jgi:hypothetical protein
MHFGHVLERRFSDDPRSTEVKTLSDDSAEESLFIEISLVLIVGGQA